MAFRSARLGTVKTARYTSGTEGVRMHTMETRFMLTVALIPESLELAAHCMKCKIEHTGNRVVQVGGEPSKLCPCPDR